MTRVYIAGPYSAPDHEGKELNLSAAIAAGHLAMDLGLAPLVPHLNHAMEHDPRSGRPRPYEDWMALDLAWLTQADVLWRLEGASQGADREVEAMLAAGKPVVYSFAELTAWLVAQLRCDAAAYHAELEASRLEADAQRRNLQARCTELVEQRRAQEARLASLAERLACALDEADAATTAALGIVEVLPSGREAWVAELDGALRRADLHLAPDVEAT